MNDVGGSASVLGVGRAIVVSMRPRQWTKNLVVFAALAFAGELLDWRRILLGTAAFVVFCLLSGSVYVLNDVLDMDADRLHATKKSRPVASGELSRESAVAAGTAIGLFAIACAFAISPLMGTVAVAYVALQAAYMLFLKKQVILDAMAIAAGFVLRAVAGAVAISVPVSSWLMLCTFLLALFLAFGKRRHELMMLGDEANEHRVALGHYSAPLIDSMLSTTAAATIVAYAFYTFTPTTGERYRYLMVTVPFVAYGLFRYLYLVHRHDLGGSPEEILLTDWPLIIDIVAWAAVAAVIIYVLPG